MYPIIESPILDMATKIKGKKKSNLSDRLLSNFKIFYSENYKYKLWEQKIPRHSS